MALYARAPPGRTGSSRSIRLTLVITFESQPTDVRTLLHADSLLNPEGARQRAILAETDRETVFK
jgi:hypothetical protein